MKSLVERFVISRVRPHALTVLDERFGGILAHQNIFRCPTIALYEDLGIPHLCRALICDLDFGLAKEWHATLQRPQTLAGGDYQCDFRWTPVSTEGAP